MLAIPMQITKMVMNEVGGAVNKMAEANPNAGEPKRNPALKIIKDKPFNAEPPPAALLYYITKNDLFYVRNHFAVPKVDAASYELEVTGEDMKTINLSLIDLKTKFAKYTITATLQCAGNRRSELNMVKVIDGVAWTAQGISNATWSGARLRDVLKYAGLTEANAKVHHVQFEGLDFDSETNLPYGASIFVEKAMDPAGDVILAYEMNDETLPRDHGFPVRVVVPGVVGARHVKWLRRIIAGEDECMFKWQQTEYKGFSPHFELETVDFSTAPAIQEMPVQSAVLEPVNGGTIKANDNTVTIKGYAWSGGGRGIVRVDVSIDGGRNFEDASLLPSDMQPRRAWGWTMWKAHIPLPGWDHANPYLLDICCRAVDTAYNIQPEEVAPIWNLHGVLNNAWHRIQATVTP